MPTKQTDDSGLSWKRIEPTERHKIGWRQIVTKTFVMPNGQKATFDTIGAEGQKHVNVIALTLDNKVILAKQFRVGPQRVMYELPGGSVDDNEDIEATIKRELIEETGYKVGAITYLGELRKDAYMNASWHGYLARDCTLTANQKLDMEEHIEVCLVSIDELIDKAKHGLMTDPGTVLMAYDQLMSTDSHSRQT